MCVISFAIFLISVFTFIGIMVRDPRTLWSGFSFFWMLVCLALFAFFVMSQYSDQLAEHDWIMGVLIALFIATICCILAFPGLLIAVFLVEGIKVIRNEGAKPSNLLSMFFALLLCAYLTVWPQIEDLTANTFGTTLYAMISLAATYVISLMAVYALSAFFNLIHLKKNRNADYIVVLGCGIIGTKVTQLMAGKKPKIIIVTTSYHVFRSLLLTKQQKIKCVGFGAKTKWYFTLNALLREFIGYLQMTWKKHAIAIGIASGIILVSKFIEWSKLANYI